jgi:hypothetical protein
MLGATEEAVKRAKLPTNLVLPVTKSFHAALS